MKICSNCYKSFEQIDWHCPNCGFVPENNKGVWVVINKEFPDEESYPINAFKELVEREEKHFWFKYRNQIIQWGIQKYFSNILNFMEIGCGTGFVLKGLRAKFPDLALYGSDLFIQGLQVSKGRFDNVEMLQINALDIPYIDEFDVIGAFDVIEHIDEDLAVLDQLYKATRPGGGVMITVPQHQFLWSPADDVAYHKRRYSRQELVGKIKKAGFSIQYVTSFVTIPFPLMLLSRLFSRAQVDDFDVYREFDISPFVNMIMDWTLKIEYFFIQLGVRLPFGGSLFVVGKK